MTKTKWVAIGVAIVLASSFLMVLFFENLENSGISYPIRVACVGDSITEGTFYPANLQDLLGDNYTVGNFGVGASTVLLETHKPYMNQAAFQNAKRFQPNIVIIMLGTNDAWPDYYTQLEEFVADYKTLVNEFQVVKPKPEVWLVKPPPVFNDSLGPNNANLVEGVIPRIEQVADELHLPVIDVYAVLIDHPDYFSDGVHPNSEGAKLIANEIYSAVIQNTVYS